MKEKLFCFYLNIGVLTTYNKTTLQEVKKYFEIQQNSYSIQVSEILIW